MTREEAAAALNGCEYGSEGWPELWEQMKAAGLVAVFGYSDDVTEFRGAFDEETGCGVQYLNETGLLVSRCDEGDDCPYFKDSLHNARTITPTQEGDYTHTYQTDIPHVTFEVVEDDGPFCRGIVFALADAA